MDLRQIARNYYEPLLKDDGVENETSEIDPEIEGSGSGISLKRRLLGFIVAGFIWISSFSRTLEGIETTAGLMGALMGSLLACYGIYYVITRA